MNLNDEVICGYLVTAKQKQINAVYLDLLLEFERLCKKAGLTYWVFDGALLGAVRHKGFIPWDDDVDIAMPRPDFDRLLAMTSEEFGARDPYFLQNGISDPGYHQTLIRFRRSNTTAIMDYDLAWLQQHPYDTPYNMGINLTIFPLSRLPKSPVIRKLQPKLSLVVECIEYRANRQGAEKPFRNRLAKTIIHLAGYKNIIKFKHWLYHGWPQNPHDPIQCFDGQYSSGGRYHQEDFRDTVMLPFEDIFIPAPIGYNRVLTDSYGDYMTFPPAEEQSHPHDGNFDPGISYLTTIQQLRAGGI